MTIALVFLAAIMACFVGWLVRQSLIGRPWIASDAPLGALAGVGPTLRRERSLRVALGVLVAVITSLFALFASAYMMRMMQADWHSPPLPNLLWVNTGVLVLGSLTLQVAWNAARHDHAVQLKPALLAAGMLTLAFIAGQWQVWRELSASGHYLASNPANAFFYVLTALHALHLLGGLVAWARTSVRVWRGATAGEVRLATELCALYWHFLLGVWLVLFVLLSTH